MRFLSEGRGAALALGTLLLAGCDAAPGPSVLDGGGRAKAREELLQSYQPPADEKLTPKQVELYLAVQERLRSAPPRPPPAGGGRLSEAIEAGAPDLGVARELKANVEEYLWIKERILEADAATLTARLNAEALAAVETTLAGLRKKRETAADDASRKLIDEQIALFESEAERLLGESKEREPEWIRANQRTLEPFRARLAPGAGEGRRERPVGPAASPAGAPVVKTVKTVTPSAARPAP